MSLAILNLSSAISYLLLDILNFCFHLADVVKIQKFKKKVFMTSHLRTLLLLVLYAF